MKTPEVDRTYSDAPGLQSRRRPGGPAHQVRSRLVWINVGLRALVEIGVIAGLAYWGYQLAEGVLVSLLLAAGAVLIGFGFWGLVDFRQAGRWAEPMRLTQELAISGLVAAAWWTSGIPVLGVALGSTSAVYHVLVYVAGDRLLTVA